MTTELGGKWKEVGLHRRWGKEKVRHRKTGSGWGRKEQARHLVGGVRATSSVTPGAARTIVPRQVRGTSCNPSNQSLKFSYMEASTVDENF